MAVSEASLFFCTSYHIYPVTYQTTTACFEKITRLLLLQSFPYLLVTHLANEIHPRLDDSTTMRSLFDITLLVLSCAATVSSAPTDAINVLTSALATYSNPTSSTTGSASSIPSTSSQSIHAGRDGVAVVTVTPGGGTTTSVKFITIPAPPVPTLSLISMNVVVDPNGKNARTSTTTIVKYSSSVSVSYDGKGPYTTLPVCTARVTQQIVDPSSTAGPSSEPSVLVAMEVVGPNAKDPPLVTVTDSNLKAFGVPTDYDLSNGTTSTTSGTLTVTFALAGNSSDSYRDASIFCRFQNPNIIDENWNWPQDPTGPPPWVAISPSYGKQC